MEELYWAQLVALCWTRSGRGGYGPLHDGAWRGWPGAPGWGAREGGGSLSSSRLSMAASAYPAFGAPAVVEHWRCAVAISQ